MAKDKSKSKGKKKLKALEKNAENAAKSEIDKAKSEFGKVKSEIADAPVTFQEVKAATEVSFDKVPSEDTLIDLADQFKLFADPTRLRILYALMGGGKCVADISEAAGVSQSATSHQLRSMKQAHLVKFVREGKQVIYSLASDSVKGMLAQGLASIKG